LLLEKLGFHYTHDEYYSATGLDHPSYLLTADEYVHQSEASRPASRLPGSDGVTIDSDSDEPPNEFDL
jgi:hypothetical protein